jgi:integrase
MPRSRAVERKSTAIKLTVAAVARLEAGKKRREILDAGGPPGMYLVIQDSGAKSWVLRFKQAGRRYKLFIGTCDTSTTGKKKDAPELGGHHTLADARVLAFRYHGQVAAGRNPVLERKAAKTAARAKVPQTGFAAAARDYIEEHCRPRFRGWARTAKTLGLLYKNDKESFLIKGGLCQRWGDRPVSEITEDDCFAIIDGARTKGIPGRGVRTNGQSSARERDMANALGGLFRWLRAKRKIAVNPVSGLERPEGSGEGTRVLGDDELRRIWEACDEGPFGRIVRLLMLTGQRTGEVSGMRWSELSKSSREDLLWTIPAARAKNKREHVVPLAPAVQKLLEPARADSSFVFTTTGRTPVSGFSKAKARLDRRLKFTEPWQLRDLRRTMVTGMAELGVQPHVIEAVVNHVSGHRGGIAGIYNKAEYAEPKRKALERWAAHVEAIVEGRKEGKVVPLRA